MKRGLKKLHISILLTSLLLFILQGLVLSQTTGNIAGKVTDAATGDPLPSAIITVLGTSLSDTTDFEGKYIIVNSSHICDSIECALVIKPR